MGILLLIVGMGLLFTSLLMVEMDTDIKWLILGLGILVSAIAAELCYHGLA